MIFQKKRIMHGAIIIKDIIIAQHMRKLQWEN